MRYQPPYASQPAKAHNFPAQLVDNPAPQTPTSTHRKTAECTLQVRTERQPANHVRQLFLGSPPFPLLGTVHTPPVSARFGPIRRRSRPVLKMGSAQVINFLHLLVSKRRRKEQDELVVHQCLHATHTHTSQPDPRRHPILARDVITYHILGQLQILKLRFQVRLEFFPLKIVRGNGLPYSGSLRGRPPGLFK